MKEKITPRFQLEHTAGVAISDDDLISDLRQTMQQLNLVTISNKEYERLGRFSHTTFIRRFGSWNKALEIAGASISNRYDIPDSMLFENILTLWQQYGRQPRRRELAQAPSTISEGPYRRRFRSWRFALEAFIEYANVQDENSPPVKMKLESRRSATTRDPSLRLRFQVLQRDRFSCRQCGESPSNRIGCELHVDHIIPWNKGGETQIDNLQTLCMRCNIGKADLTPTMNAGKPPSEER